MPNRQKVSLVTQFLIFSVLYGKILKNSCNESVWYNHCRGYREKNLFRSLTKRKEVVTKVLGEKENCGVKEDGGGDGDKKVSPQKERHDSVDSEPMLTIDDSAGSDECEITDPTVASELRILELAEQLEERLFVAFLHSKVMAVHSMMVCVTVMCLIGN